MTSQQLLDQIIKIFRLYRKQTGMTQPELASRIGMSRTYIAMLETAHTSPKMEDVLNIARVLGCRHEVMNLFEQFFRGQLASAQASGQPQRESVQG